MPPSPFRAFEALVSLKRLKCGGGLSLRISSLLMHSDAPSGSFGSILLMHEMQQ
jgi:hypothetical protein